MRAVSPVASGNQKSESEIPDPRFESEQSTTGTIEPHVPDTRHLRKHSGGQLSVALRPRPCCHCCHPMRAMDIHSKTNKVANYCQPKLFGTHSSDKTLTVSAYRRAQARTLAGSDICGLRYRNLPPAQERHYQYWYGEGNSMLSGPSGICIVRTHIIGRYRALLPLLELHRPGLFRWRILCQWLSGPVAQSSRFSPAGSLPRDIRNPPGTLPRRFSALVSVSSSRHGGGQATLTQLRSAAHASAFPYQPPSKL